LLGFCATATKARQINDRQQQRAWRHLVQERLEQLVNELFLEVQVAVNGGGYPGHARTGAETPRLLTTMGTR